MNQNSMVMKRILLSFVFTLSCLLAGAQSVFTVVYATSSDDFVNVRAQPSSKARVLKKLFSAHHGLGEGVLRGYSGNWTKVSVGNVTGWAYSKYVGQQTWYTGTGSRRLIAASKRTPVYGEDYTGEQGRPLFTTLEKGTIIADDFQEEGEYYVLTTGHDYLFIPKSDVRVEAVR